MKPRTDLDPTAQTLGQLLRHARHKSGQSLREIASQAEIAVSYLSLLERDGCGPPNDDKLQRLAEVLGESDTELFARAGRVSPRVGGIILQNPTEWTDVLEAGKDLNASDLRLLKEALLKAVDSARKRKFAGSFTLGTEISPVPDLHLEWTDVLEAGKDLDASDFRLLEETLLKAVDSARERKFAGSFTRGTEISPLADLHLDGVTAQPEIRNIASSRPTPSQLKAIVEAAEKEEEKIQKKRRSMHEEEVVR